MTEIGNETPEEKKVIDEEQIDKPKDQADILQSRAHASKSKKVTLNLILETSCEEHEEIEALLNINQLSQKLSLPIEEISLEKIESLYSIYKLTPEEALQEIESDFKRRILITIKPTVTQLINGALWLYLTGLRQYLPTALMSVLWFLGCVPIVTFLEDLLLGSTELGSGLAIFLLPLGVGWIGFSMAKSFALATAIAKGGFGRLNHAPLSIGQARQFTARRKGRFLLINLVLLLFIGLASYIILSLARLVFAEPFELGFEVVALGIIPLLLLGMAFLWLGARLALADLPLATQESYGAIASIETAWQLTRGHAPRILQAMAGLAVVVAPPLLFIRTVIVQISASLLMQVPNVDSTLNLALSITLPYFHLIVMGILGIPVWQCLRTVTYYDLLGQRQAQPLAEESLEAYILSSGQF